MREMLLSTTVLASFLAGAGSEVDLSSLGGRPTVVNLWASWCPQCRAEMPLLRRAHTDYGTAVQFLGVNSIDRPDYATTMLADLGVTYPQVVDRDGQLLAERASLACQSPSSSTPPAPSPTRTSAHSATATSTPCSPRS